MFTFRPMSTFVSSGCEYENKDMKRSGQDGWGGSHTRSPGRLLPPSTLLSAWVRLTSKRGVMWVSPATCPNNSKSLRETLLRWDWLAVGVQGVGREVHTWYKRVAVTQNLNFSPGSDLGMFSCLSKKIKGMWLLRNENMGNIQTEESRKSSLRGREM